MALQAEAENSTFITEVFVSDSRKGIDFARKLEKALEAGKTHLMRQPWRI